MVSRRTVWTWMLAAGGAVGLAGLPGTAAADVPAAARTAYIEGRWLDASRLAEAGHTPDALAFAARARVAAVVLSGANRASRGDLSQARRLAEAALADSPRHVEARVQLATILGLEARRGSPAMSLAQGRPQQVRTLLLAILHDAPSDPWALSLLGGWHLESIRMGGQAAAQVLGSDVATGKGLFRRAVEASPGEPTIPFYYACALLGLERSTASDAEIRSLLATALSRPPRDAFQREVSRRAGLIRSHVTAGRFDAARELVLGWM